VDKKKCARWLTPWMKGRKGRKVGKEEDEGRKEGRKEVR
jgi:hypothetical protein